MSEPITTISGLSIDYVSSNRRVSALEQVDLEIPRGKILGIVGESGSGKTTLSLAIVALLDNNAQIVGGNISFQGHSVLGLTEQQWQKIRGEKIGYVFQDPYAALNPTMTVIKHFVRATGSGGKNDQESFLKLLSQVGFQEPESILDKFPHELSGGMAQRVSISLAMLKRPALVIADEPTASLDASIKSDLMERLTAVTRQYNTTLIVITHDLSIVRKYCEQIAVMYCGRIIEAGDCLDVLSKPAHPYTQALIRVAFSLEEDMEELPTIPGLPLTLIQTRNSCSFHNRCPACMARCRVERPEMVVRPDMRKVMCFLEDGQQDARPWTGRA